MGKKESLTDLGWRTILTKGWWSLLYIGIFVFGKYIPLPFANLTTKGGNIMLAATSTKGLLAAMANMYGLIFFCIFGNISLQWQFCNFFSDFLS